MQEVFRETQASIHELALWREDLIMASREGLKTRPVSLPEKKLRAAQAKIGELSMELEVVRSTSKKGGCGHRGRFSGGHDGTKRVKGDLCRLCAGF
jgi:hypothetical protein